MKTSKPLKGDIIRSPAFAYATHPDPYNPDKKMTLDAGVGPGRHMSSILKKTKVTVDGKEYKHEEWVEIDESRHDPSRGEANFLVLEARMQGGSNGRDPYPDGWHVVAERMDESRERIQFYMSGCFIHMIEEVERVDEMPSIEDVAKLVEEKLAGEVNEGVVRFVVSLIYANG